LSDSLHARQKPELDRVALPLSRRSSSDRYAAEAERGACAFAQQQSSAPTGPDARFAMIAGTRAHVDDVAARGAEQSPTGSYGGQCYVFMSNVVYKASGDRSRIEGSHTYYGAYQRAGATLQTDASARPGDIIQVYDRYNDDEYIPGMHTAIITANLGHGEFDVIDANWGYTQQVNRHELDPWTQLADSNSALRVAIWRVGQVSTTATTPAPTGLPLRSTHTPSPTPTPGGTVPPPPLTPPTFHVYGVPSGQSLLVRPGPGTGYSYVAQLYNGDAVELFCQTTGTLVEGRSDIWDEIGPNRYVSDYYIDTPGVGVFQPGVPRCSALG
jgi:hypothetical protein